MRKTMIFGAFAALLGLAAVAQANDRPQSGTPDNTEMAGQATQDTANDRDGVKHDREARNEHGRNHKDETGERRGEARERHEAGHDADEGAERKRR